MMTLLVWTIAIDTIYVIDDTFVPDVHPYKGTTMAEDWPDVIDQLTILWVNMLRWIKCSAS